MANNVVLLELVLETAYKKGGYNITEAFPKALSQKLGKEGMLELKPTNVNKNSYIGNITPIHIACFNQDRDIFYHFYSKAHDMYKQIGMNTGYIHLIAAAGNTKALEVFREMGGDINQPGPQKKTPLMIACSLGHL